MPKVTKKNNRIAEQSMLVEAAPMAPEIEQGRDGEADEPRNEQQSEQQMTIPRPKFAAITSYEENGRKVEFRRVPVPQHRMTPLKNSWMALYKPVTETLKLDMRMNLKSKKVEIKTTEHTVDGGSLQRAADFVHAFILGFDVKDAIALLRLDDLYIECFEIKDVKTLRGEHLARCIGRLAGKNGKTKFTIENSTRTRIIVADTKIHILGSFQNIRVARDALCSLILGSPAGKVYTKLRSVTARLNSAY